MNRRHFIFGASLMLVSACDQKQALEPSLASSLNVQEVTVTMSHERPQTSVTDPMIIATTREKLTRSLTQANPGGVRPVRAEVNIFNFAIANALTGILGAPHSSISTRVTLIDLASGEMVREPFNVIGTTGTRVGMLATPLIEEPKKELETITTDLAAKTKVAIFGTQALQV